MCTEKNSASCCCDGMVEMMKNCCPDCAGDSDCFAKMKEMKDTYFGQKVDDEAKEEKQGCCG